MPVAISEMTKPVECTPEIGAEICRRLMGGESLARICRDEHMPEYWRPFYWLAHDDPPWFVKDYTRARELSGHTDADKIGDIAADVVAGDIEPNAGRVAIDALKWTSGRKLPKVYGAPQLNVKHSGAVGTFDAAGMTDEQLDAIESAIEASLGGTPTRGRDAATGEGGEGSEGGDPEA